MLLDLAAVDLVQLGGNDNRAIAVVDDPLVHLLVIGARLVADVHQQDYLTDLLGLMQIALDHLAPFFLFGLGHLGIAITGQVHIVQSIVDVVEVDGLGLAGLG